MWHSRNEADELRSGRKMFERSEFFPTLKSTGSIRESARGGQGAGHLSLLRFFGRAKK